jgi:hypothetical protein
MAMRTRDFEAAIEKDENGELFLGMEKAGRFIFVDEDTARKLANYILKELGE